MLQKGGMTQRTLNGRNHYDVCEAAERLGLAVPTVYGWIAQRRLTSLKLGRRVFIPVAEVERVLAESLRPRLVPQKGAAKEEAPKEEAA